MRLPTISGEELKEYFLSHVIPTPCAYKGFYTVHTPINAFKKLMSRRVAYLIIPKGAIIYACDSVFASKSFSTKFTRKMRCSEAKVKAIYSLPKKTNLLKGYSGWDYSFVYTAGKTVKPVGSFSFNDSVCDSGIHFFLNVQDALDYQA